MKKIITLTLSLILIACTPQATEPPTATLPPPTQTSIPTPTLHPEFVELQNLIADSGENLTLLPNGQIEENGVVIPNLQVDLDGEITILVDGESIIVNSTDITYEDGFQIKGFELKDGKWVEAVSEALLKVQADFDKYDYDYSSLAFDENDEGKVVAMDNERGVVYEDGEFDLYYVIEQAAKLDLMPTNIEYRDDLLEGAGFYGTENDNIAFEYFGPLFKRVRDEFISEYGFDPYTKGKTIAEYVMLNPEILAWGQRLILDKQDPETQTYLYYELKDGAIHIVPLK